MDSDSGASLEFVRKLSAVGIALSSEKDNGRLMELILDSARELTGADGGTIYSRTEDDELRFEIMITESLGVREGGTSGEQVSLPGIALFDEDGQPNRHNVAAWAAVTGETVNISDAYDAEHYDFSGTRAFDRRTGYRSTSFLTVPLRNHEDDVIGVLQLINALDDSGRPESFGARAQLLVESLASQAAIALTKKRLIDEQKELFESFIELIAAAIDDKSPFTGGHCRRVPELTMMLAESAAATPAGPLADFHMTDDDRYELRIAGWLHDCGKVTTPDHITDKSTKLETIFDRIELVRSRYEILRRDAEIASLRNALDRALAGEARDTINHHIVATIRMLESLPYPKHLRRVPEFVGGHHERMDGKGYPRGLTRSQMSVQARVMGIADIFEALTASDRPYKPAMKLSEALRILGRMKLDNHIDPDLFDVFVHERIYLRYAKRFLDPKQIDEIDHAVIPGLCAPQAPVVPRPS
jgi:HD-GYP domain-containing protein (c-di-GMP phosphodiesterase class II)